MTQARDTLPLRLQLVPMQVPEAPTEPVGRWHEALEIAEGVRSPVVNGRNILPPPRNRCDLVLHPGEPSEILVKLENIGDRTLAVNAAVTGNFPPEWCQLGTEGHELPAGGKMEAVLYFNVPPNFFESPEIISANPARLDFQGRLSVACTEENRTGEHQDSAAFHLYLRPRSLYLEFLPELYQEVDFIGRLLSIFEQSFETTVQAMDAIWAYLDPLMAPESLLPFLAYWVGWEIDPHLSLAQQRYLIRYAIELYRWRGTRRGLRFYLYLYTNLPLDEHLPEDEKHISIQEVFSQGLVLGRSRLGEDTSVGGGQPYHFIVKLKPDYPNQIDERLVRKIIEQEKPAFCTYDLYINSINTIPRIE